MGGHTSTAVRTTATTPPLSTAHPQAVEPVAGNVVTANDHTVGPGAGGVAADAAIASHHPKVTGPASVTNAPARGAPTDAEVKAAIAKFQLAVAQYHLDRLNFSSALLNAATLPPASST